MINTFPSWLEITLKLCLLGGMVIGLVGLIVPIFPGITVIWLLIILYGVLFGWGNIGLWLFVLITILAIVGWLADNVLMSGKARLSGASWTSLAIAFAAGTVGSIILTPIGGILVTLLALYFAENTRRRNHQESLQIVKDMALGWGWSFVVRFGIGVLMIGLWLLWAW